MCRLIANRTALLLIVVSVAGVAMGQSPDPIRELSQTLSAADALIDGGTAGVESVEILAVEQAESKSVDAWVQAQSQSYNSVSGVELRAGYDRKYGTGSEDIYDDLYSYKNRFDAMVSWNILRSGVVGRKANTELLELEGQKMLLDELSAFNTELVRTHSHRQEQILDGYLNNIYRAQIEVCGSLTALLRSLQAQGQATTMEIAQLEMEM
ncbi:MAG: hypothetical protein R3Y68_04110 [Rikenellaceae bacterium]